MLEIGDLLLVLVQQVLLYFLVGVGFFDVLGALVDVHDLAQIIESLKVGRLLCDFHTENNNILHIYVTILVTLDKIDLHFLQTQVHTQHLPNRHRYLNFPGFGNQISVGIV